MPKTRPPSAHLPRAISFLVAVCGFAIAPAVHAGPRIGIVIAAHEGMSAEQADEIAFDLAGSVAGQIEGGAIAGASVRELLTEAVPAGCEDDAACGRRIAKQLKTDEVLFLAMKRVGKKDTAIVCHRVARDPDRVPTDGNLALAGNKAKRGRSVSDLVTTLYPKGSVVVWTEPPPEAIVAAPKEPPPPVKKDESAGPITKKWWFWTAVAGGAVVLGGAIAGIAIAAQPGPSAPSVTLPP